jgi:hypothetical protein
MKMITTAAAAPLLLYPIASYSDENGYESRIGRSWPLLVELGGRRLFCVASDGGHYSNDSGRTWSAPFKLMQHGKPLLDAAGKPTGDVGLLTPMDGWLSAVSRLLTGRLAGIYRVLARDLNEQYRHNSRYRVYYITSDDEGKTWSNGVPVGLPGEAFEMINRLIELRSGRLVLPTNWYVADYEHPEYKGEGIGHSFKGGYGTYQGRRMLVEGHEHTPEFGGVVVYYSDDKGKTWQSGPNNLWIWPLPSEGGWGGHSTLDEPTAMELEDNQLLMLCRTVMGRLYECRSTDGGIHWSVPKPTELASSDSPCALKGIPSTGHLVVAWNQVSGEEIIRGLKRNRLCVAVSKDGGNTWVNFKTLEAAALPQIGRIQPPPIRHYHSLDDVGNIPLKFGNFQYPSISFIGDMILFSYGVDEMKPVSEWTDKTPIYGERLAYGKVRAVPVSWLYRPGIEL